MSKTTFALFFFLLIAIGFFLYIKYENPQSAIMKSLTQTSSAQPVTSDTTLSLTSATQIIQRGQTLSVAIAITNQGLIPSLAQLEVAYDPTVVTALSILPGTFLNKPTIVLQNIRPDLGRISYALKCPTLPNNTVPDCANASSNNLAVMTFLVNAAAAKPQTTISLLPKTVIRSRNGTDLLHKTTGVTLTIAGAALPTASAAAVVHH